jgi:hypothetical protein
MVKPSETTTGRAWLENFTPVDRPAAQILLDSLRFVDLDTLRNDLTSKLEAVPGKAHLRAPALLLAERKLEDLVERDKREAPVAYVDFHPGAALSPTPGSEAFIGGVLRDFAASDRKSAGLEWMAPDAELEELRDRRCRSIVLVTDYCGTGDRILKFAAALARNPAIRSWRSMHLIDFHVISYAASSVALRRFEDSPLLAGIEVVEAAPTFATAPWSNTVRETIIELCERERRTKRWRALGYGETGGLFATALTAPNNLPAVFLQETEGWQPLLGGRKVTPEANRDLVGHQPVEPLADLAERVGQLRLGQNERLQYMRERSRDLLQILVSIHRAPKTEDELAVELGRPLAEIADLLHTLRAFEMIDQATGITITGRKEIDAQKRALRRTNAGLEGSEDTYYPRSLK